MAKIVKAARVITDNAKKIGKKVVTRVKHETKGIDKPTALNPNPRNPKNPTLYQRAQILAGGTEDAGSIRGSIAGAKFSAKKAVQQKVKKLRRKI